MFTFRRKCSVLILSTLVLLAAACQPGQLFGPTPTPTPTSTPTPNPVILVGDWKADTDFGTIRLTVQPDGRTISTPAITFISGGNASLSIGTDEYEFSNFTFEYETTQGQSTYTFHFTFNQDGETGTVVWEGPNGKTDTVDMFKIQ